MTEVNGDGEASTTSLHTYSIAVVLHYVRVKDLVDIKPINSSNKIDLNGIISTAKP
ncbi:hypothetical protein NFHSH190041_29550 [Shewanella sp. NFH-SH190041]|nr:hypothetical protein NFHSH190041_29550 [Shewanella sp. NFH-SH190041]